MSRQPASIGTVQRKLATLKERNREDKALLENLKADQDVLDEKIERRHNQVIQLMAEMDHWKKQARNFLKVCTV
jgi:hypothetical protein